MSCCTAVENHSRSLRENYHQVILFFSARWIFKVTVNKIKRSKEHRVKNVKLCDKSARWRQTTVLIIQSFRLIKYLALVSKYLVLMTL